MGNAGYAQLENLSQVLSNWVERVGERVGGRGWGKRDEEGLDYKTK